LQLVAAVFNGGSTVSVLTNPVQDGAPPSGGRKTKEAKGPKTAATAKDSMNTSEKDSRKQQKAAQRAAMPKKLATHKRTLPSKTGSKTGACCSKDHRLELKECDGAYFTALY
jgi:hypothetical protein